MRILMILPIAFGLAGCVETKVAPGVVTPAAGAGELDVDGMVAVSVVRYYQKLYGITRPISILRGEITNPAPAPIRWGTPYDQVCMKIHRTSLLSNEPTFDHMSADIRREGTRTNIRLNDSPIQSSNCTNSAYRPMRHLETVAKSNDFAPK